MLGKCLDILLREYRKRKARRQLKLQAFLTRKGVGIRTRILEVKEKRCPLADYVQFSIQARLRVNGKVVDRWVGTILTREKVIQKGELVHIRYYPSHLNNVLILK